MPAPLEHPLPRAPPPDSSPVLPTHQPPPPPQQQQQQSRTEQAAHGLGLELHTLQTSDHARRDQAGTGPASAFSPQSGWDPLDDHPPMHSRSRSKPSNKPDRLHLAASTSSSPSSPRMNTHVEYRGKSSSLESPTARLMGREDFSLDDEPPATPTTPVASNHSFWELPQQDRRNFSLLVLLYFLQGVPMGLATGSVPFLLKEHLSYSQIGVFSLASYPYSLKLLWSPIVDAIWSARVGRRKSWIMPIQALSGFGMLWLGARAKQMMLDAGAGDGSGVWSFTLWWFFLVFMCATQDIAVDGEQIWLSESPAR